MRKSGNLEKTWVTSILLLINGAVFAQQVITEDGYIQTFDAIGTSGLPANWTIRTGSNASALGTTVGLNTTAVSWSDTAGAFRNVSSDNIASSSTSAEQSSNADRALGVRQSGSFGDPGASFSFSFSTVNMDVTSLSIDLMQMVAGTATNNRVTTWTLQYGLGSVPASYTTLSSFASGGATSVAHAQTFIFNLTSNAADLVAMSNQSNVWFRVVALDASTGGGTRATTAIDNFSIAATGDAPPPTATEYSWGAAGVGGAGTWDATSTNWYDAVGNENVVWDGTKTAIFRGTAGGAVTMSGSQSAVGLSFATTGYTLSGDSLTLTGEAGQVSVASGATATIASDLLGAAFTKAGAGDLNLNGTAAVTGNFTVTSGAVKIEEYAGVSASDLIVAGGASLRVDGTFFRLSTGISNVQGGNVLFSSTGTLVQQGNGSLTNFLFGNSNVTWETGSTLIFRDFTSSISASGRTYNMNVLFETSGGPISTGNISGGSALTVNGDLAIGEGVTFNYATTNRIATNFNGNVTIAGNLGGLGGASSFTVADGKTLLVGAPGQITLGTDQKITFSATSIYTVAFTSIATFGKINGDLALDGSFLLHFFAIDFGIYDLYTAGTGSFANVSFWMGSDEGDFNYDALSGLWTADNGGVSFTFDALTGELTLEAIPEPSTLALIGLGTLAMIFRRRRGSLQVSK